VLLLGIRNLTQPSARCPAGDLAPTDSYVIPSWGGVVIYNPPDPAAGAQPPNRPATLVLSSAQLSSAHFSTAELAWHPDHGTK
jgi:Phosphatidylinositol-glycan biosynthesis class S protein